MRRDLLTPATSTTVRRDPAFGGAAEALRGTPGGPSVQVRVGLRPTPSAEVPAPRDGRTAGALAVLPTIALAELTSDAALLTRQDRKYLVDATDLPQVIDLIRRGAPGAAALEIDGRRVFGYESVYYDTPTLTSYLQAARRRPRRFKVRARAYQDTGTSFLEVKTRDGRNCTVKSRLDLPHRGEAWGLDLDPLAQSFVADRLERAVAEPDEVAWSLTPTLTTRYRRITLFLPATADAAAARVTLDTALSATDRYGATLELPHAAIVETKTVGRACAADRVLWGLGSRPAKVSKYGTALAALHPALPSHKWHPVLRRLGIRPDSLAASHRARPDSEPRPPNHR